VAIGGDPDGEAWRVAIREPSGAGEPVAIVELRDRALGVSAPHGRTVRFGGADMGHVMDPRSGRPAEACRLAAVACESACDADALSTALLVLGASLEDDLRAQGCDTWTV
jgi:thiamine biosynthesis lipoprotein